MKNVLGLKIDTERDWKILCASSLAFVSAVLMADIYLFYGGYDSVDVSAVTSTDSALALDRARLNRVVSDWRAREDNYNKLR